MEINEAEKMYNQLCAITSSVTSDIGTVSYEIWSKADNIIKGLSQCLGDKAIADFCITDINGANRYTNIHTYKPQLNGAMQYVYRQYGDQLKLKPPEGVETATQADVGQQSINISQNQENSQKNTLNNDLRQTVIVIENKLKSLRDKYEAGSKEAEFIEELKLALPKAKSSLELINTLLGIAIKLGLGIPTVVKILS